MGTIGIEWVNKYHGRASDLKNNSENARGFYNTLSGVRQFQYGDDLAWDQDFEQSGVGTPSTGTDTVYADNVDIVFFSGHGSLSGPIFGIANRDDGTAKSSEIRLGNKCKWIIFDACKVLLESNRTTWVQVFKGLHGILGFHTKCSDAGSRGRRFAERLNQGYKVRNAWIKACEETEDTDTWWATYFAVQNSWATLDDHWIGKGSVAANPSKPERYVYSRGSC